MGVKRLPNTRAKRETLALIAERPGITVIEIADVRQKDVGGIAATIGRLAAHGLIRIELERREIGAEGGNPLRRHCYPIPEAP